MLILTKNTDRSKLEILFLNLTILLYLCRTPIPAFKLPFLAFFTGIIVYSLFKYRDTIKSKSIDFLKHFRLVLVLAFLLILSFLLSDKTYIEIFKDVLNAIVLICLFYIGFLFIKEVKDLNEYYKSFLILTIAFALIISVKLFCDLFEISLPVTADTESIEVDINFGSLPVIFGLISAFILKINSNSFARKNGLNILMVVFFITVLVNGSRRGIIVLTLFICLMLGFFIVSLFNKSQFFKKTSISIISFLVYILFSSVILYFITFSTSYEFKNRTLLLLNSRDITAAKTNIAISISRYISIFDRHYNYFDLYRYLFHTPADPDSGWGTRIHKTVFPLTGINSQIVPPEAKGYLMDSTCNSDSRSGNAYSYTAILSEFVKKDVTLEVSVFCYVSEEFNGTWAMLTSEGKLVGKTESEYDLGKKGTWQKLILNFKSTGGIINSYLYFSKFGVKDFSSLDGYVIYAYPEVMQYPSDSISRSAMSLNYAGFTGIFKKNDMLYQDPLRKLFYNILTEDTTYNQYRAELNVDTNSIDFAYDRYLRWKFAWQIYTKEFNSRKKIMGGGFNFLNWYGYYFLKDKTASDWPHNPFLSILLYSGIIGLFLYLLLLYKAFLYYIRYIKDYYLFFIFFLVTFFFSFFSGGSPFDPPIMGFFTILPFLIHSIHNKAKVNNEDIDHR